MKTLKEYQEIINETHDYKLKTNEELIKILIQEGFGNAEFNTADIERIIKQNQEMEKELKEKQFVYDFMNTRFKEFWLEAKLAVFESMLKFMEQQKRKVILKAEIKYMIEDYKEKMQERNEEFAKGLREVIANLMGDTVFSEQLKKK